MRKDHLLPRVLKLEEILKKKSYFLLGPRQTGKTTLLKQIKNCLYINLLDSEDYLTLSSRPALLSEIVAGKGTNYIVIDEIQKLPLLLDQIHILMEENQELRFLLTGSSARKLRAQGVNTLGGRAGKQLFLPLVSKELDDRKSIDDLMLYGGIPSVLLSEDPWDKLKDYVGLYLKEEIQAETIVRNMGNFSRFIQTAALINGEQLNYSKVANDAQVPARTVKDYFQVLEDTLIGYQLEPYRPKNSRKFVSIPKFYFFDMGVTNYLLGRKKINKGTIEYGKIVEHLIFTELFAYIHLIKKGEATIFYWRTQSQLEVDFVIEYEGNFIAIEVKASSKLSVKQLHPMQSLEKEVNLKRKIFVTSEPRLRITDKNEEIYPIKRFLTDLWAGEIF